MRNLRSQLATWQVQVVHTVTLYTTAYSLCTSSASNLLAETTAHICSLAELKRNILGAPFNKALTALQTGMSSSLPMMCVPWRRSEDVYIVPQVSMHVTASCAVRYSSTCMMLRVGTTMRLVTRVEA